MCLFVCVCFCVYVNCPVCECAFVCSVCPSLSHYLYVCMCLCVSVSKYFVCKYFVFVCVCAFGCFVHFHGTSILFSIFQKHVLVASVPVRLGGKIYYISSLRDLGTLLTIMILLMLVSFLLLLMLLFLLLL